MLGRFALLGCVVLSALISASPAQAEGACPPGMFPVEGAAAASSGWTGCRPVYNASPSENSPNPGPGRPQPPRQQPPDPMKVKLNAATKRIQAIEHKVKQKPELLNDPKVQTSLNGTWEFFQAQHKAAPGEFCTAFFWRKEGFVTLSGRGGGSPAALLTFFGKDIPRPNSVETIQITLTQGNEAPQTLQAFNYVMSPDADAAITVSVPNIDAALAGMEDTQSFDVAIASKSVVTVEWRGGLAARDKLRECVNARSLK
jgi:hypothetical protein